MEFTSLVGFTRNSQPKAAGITRHNYVPVGSSASLVGFARNSQPEDAGITRRTTYQSGLARRKIRFYGRILTAFYYRGGAQ